MTFFQSIFLDPSDLALHGFLIRSIIIYIFLLIMTRIMGPVQMGEMTAIDFIAAVTIGSIASATVVESEVHFLASLVNIAFWSFLTIALNLGGAYFPGLRRILVGRPIILIKKGKVMEKNLTKARMNYDDLVSSLRLMGVPLVDDVEFAILEPKGEVSVTKKSQKEALTPEDLKIKTEYQGIPNVLVMNGKPAKDNLEKLGYNEQWLQKKLQNAGVDKVSNVSFAQIDSNGNLYIDLYDDKKAQPSETKGRECIAKFQKAAAELSQYALETNAPHMQEMYQGYASQIERMLEDLKPKLLQAEELND